MPQSSEFAPRLLPSPQAAHYLGVSESTLRNLGLPRRELGSKRLYDKVDLDAFADNLPYEAGSSGGDNTCDQVFG